MWFAMKPAISSRPASSFAGASATIRSAISTMRPSAMAISNLVLGPPALTQKEIEGHGWPAIRTSHPAQNSTSSSSNSSGSVLAPATHSCISGIAMMVLQ